MRRISPAPRKKLAAFEYVGAAIKLAAAKAPSNLRRDIFVSKEFIIYCSFMLSKRIKFTIILDRISPKYIKVITQDESQPKNFF